MMFSRKLSSRGFQTGAKASIAVAPGDGIGKEIMEATLHVLKAARVPLIYNYVDMGKELYLKGHSSGMTDDAKAMVESTKILLKGPMETPKGSGVKSINVTARKVWSTYANKRTIQTLPGVDTIFSRAGININITLLRENIEDTYGGIEHYQTHDVAQCRRLITRVGCEQIHRQAFEIAASKSSHRVTCCHKANIMKLTDGLFLETFYKIAKEYPGLKADDIIVDDLAMKLVSRPDKFDVIVLPNLQGDIISDLCAGLIGGLGMAPSANIGDEISIFEAVHGTAPDIAGKGIANPTALLLSSVMMLRHLGLNEKAEGIEMGLKSALAAGIRTGDLSQIPGVKPVSTMGFAQGIVTHLPPEATRELINVHWDRQYKMPYESEREDSEKDGAKKKLKRSFSMSKSNEEGEETLDNKSPAVVPNLMLKSPLPDQQLTVGVDVFVDSSDSPSEVAAIVQAALVDKDIKLVMISNRGTQVWPTGSDYTQCVNHYRCRLQVMESKDAIHGKVPSVMKGKSEVELLKDVADVAKSIRVCSLEMLLAINGKKLFTLAQGQ